MKKKEKKVIIEKAWHIKEIIYEDGTKQMQRTNDGFNPLELLGICNLASIEIREQICGNIKPEVIKRNVITN